MRQNAEVYRHRNVGIMITQFCVLIRILLCKKIVLLNDVRRNF